jgi:hypothetical protein
VLRVADAPEGGSRPHPAPSARSHLLCTTLPRCLGVVLVAALPPHPAAQLAGRPHPTEGYWRGAYVGVKWDNCERPLYPD